MRCRAAASPATHTRVLRRELRSGHSRYERRARDRSGGPLDPAHVDIRPVHERQTSVGLADLHDHGCSRRGRQRLDELPEGGDRRLVAGQQVRRRAVSDGVAAAGAGDRGRGARSGGGGPLRQRSLPVEHDVDVELTRDGVVAERRERADDRSPTVDMEEGVAVPHREDKGFAWSIRQQHPHAPGRQRRLEASQRRPLERHSHQVRRAPFRAGDGRLEEARRFAPHPLGRGGHRRYGATVSSAGSKLTSAVSTTPAVRPGADCHDQYRLVWEITLSGVGAPHSERSSVVWASPTRIAS